ncbi:MAG: penicillin-binding protein 2, partial [Alphaproteobacteria bacterium]
YVVFVMIDEPQGTKKSYGYATGGWVAAPVVAKVVTSMAAILGLPSDNYVEAQDISLPLQQYIKPEHPEKKLASNEQ